MAKILIVDDIEDTRDGLQVVLEKLGHDIDAANDGEDADHFIASFDYDLVVTDIMMPNKNGFDLIRTIREESPETKILAISGGGQFVKSDLMSTLAGIDSNKSMQKPFTKKEFVGVVSELLSEKPAAA